MPPRVGDAIPSMVECPVLFHRTLPVTARRARAGLAAVVHRHRPPRAVPRAPRPPANGRGDPASVSAPPRLGRPARRRCAAACERKSRSGGIPGPAGARGDALVRTAGVSRVPRQGPCPHRVADPVALPAGWLRTRGPPPGRTSPQGHGGPRPRRVPVPSRDGRPRDPPTSVGHRAAPRPGRAGPTASGRCTDPGHGRASRHRSGRQHLRCREAQTRPAGPLQGSAASLRAGVPLSRACPAGGRWPPPGTGCAHRRARLPPVPRSCRWG